MENVKKQLQKTAVILVMMLLLALLLTTATYAWFSSNSTVRTSRVTGRSGTDRVELQVSTRGGDGFEAAKESGIIQINDFDAKSLMPVSTADLKNFVYSTSTMDNAAVTFVKVENEKYYYHGRVYLRAYSEGHSSDARLLLYLDSSGGGSGLIGNVKGYIRNAARLGLTFDGGSPVIFRLSEEHNPAGGQMIRTELNGAVLSENQVIDSSGDGLRAAADPSVPMSSYTAGEDGIPGNTVKALYSMELNRMYAVDVYFYMEGCDPDCSDVTQLDELDFHLAFYGVLIE